MTWHRIDDPENPAPKDGTPINLKVGDVEFAAYWSNEFLTTAYKPCGGWVACYEDDAPESWIDGCCWEVNANEVESEQPTHWMPIPATPSQK